MPGTNRYLLRLTTKIAAAYLQENSVPLDSVPGVIRAIYGSLSDLPPASYSRPPEEQLNAGPAVDVRRSVFPDYLVCLEDGERFVTLKRHLMSAHQLTEDEYRRKWRLPTDYPMGAPAYTKRRSLMAMENGLGRTRR
jgi:predicted transcriptional regulator